MPRRGLTGTSKGLSSAAVTADYACPYVALDRDAIDKAIAFARTFGTRGRVLIPPENLGPRKVISTTGCGWGRRVIPARSSRFWSGRLRRGRHLGRSRFSGCQRDLARWDLDDHPVVRDLLCELGHRGPLSRDAHLRLLAERWGVALATLQESAGELAQSADAES